jgi:hypothetical protein
MKAKRFTEEQIIAVLREALHGARPKTTSANCDIKGVTDRRNEAGDDRLNGATFRWSKKASQ